MERFEPSKYEKSVK